MKVLEALKSAATRSAVAAVGLGMIAMEIAKCALYFGLAYLGWWVWFNTDAWYYTLISIGLMTNVIPSIGHALAAIFDVVLFVVFLIDPTAFDS